MRSHLPFIPLVVLMTMLLSLPSAYGYDLGDGFHSIKISATGENRIVPRPRPRPFAILMHAAASMQVQSASAPVERQNFSEDNISPVRGSLGPVTIASLAAESLNPVNSTAKGSLSTTGATSVQGTGKGNFTPEAVGTQKVWQQSEAQSSNILKVIQAPLSFGN